MEQTDAAAPPTGLARLELMLKCAHRFSFALVGFVGVRGVGGLLVAISA